MSKAQSNKIINKEQRRKISESKKGKKHSEESKRKMSKRATGRKHSKQTKRKLSILNKISIDYILDRYSFFSKIEEMRYNPDKPIEEKEIQVHCKNHNCPNSKEHSGWFTPTYIQLYERIRNLEKTGSDLSYFYCSGECKQLCPLYNL